MEIKHLTKTYKTEFEKVEAVKQISYSFPEHGLFAIVGKSGCGKTTFLHLLSGLTSSDVGSIQFRDKELSDFSESQWDDFRNQEIGIVFQDYQLFENKTVRENLQIALDILDLENNEELRITEALAYVGLPSFEKRKVMELSGGQKQRVSIARAIIKHPSILLADEPTGHLDDSTGKDIWKLFRRISADTLVIVVTHDQHSAEIFADNIIYMQDGLITKEQRKNDIINFWEIKTEDSRKLISYNKPDEVIHYLSESCNNGKKYFQIDIIQNNEFQSNNETTVEVCKSRQPIPIKKMPYQRSMSFAWESIKCRKWRHIITALMLSLALLLAILDISLFTFNYFKPLQKYLSSYNFPYLKVGCPVSYTDSFFDIYSNELYSGETLHKKIYDSFSKNSIMGVCENQILQALPNREVNNVNIIYVSSPINGLSIEGSIPSSLNEIAITDYLAKLLLVSVGDKVELNGNTLTISGIIATDYKEYGIIEKIANQKITEIGNYKMEMEYCIALVNNQLHQSDVQKTKTLSLPGSDFVQQKKMSLYVASDISYGNRVEFDAPLLCGRDIENDDEILISESMAFYLGLSPDDFEDFLSDKVKCNYHYNNMNDPKYNNYYSYLLNFYDIFPDGVNIVGIVDELQIDFCPYILISSSKWNGLQETWADSYYFTSYFVVPDEKTFVDTLEQNNFYLDEPSAIEMFDIQKAITKLKVYILGVFLIVFALSLIMLLNCIGFSIRDSKGKIGILRALGVRKHETFLMFFWETGFIMLWSAFLSLLLSLAAFKFVNVYFKSLITENPYNILIFDWKIWASVVILSLVSAVIIQKIPLSDFSKMKPSDLLRDSES